MGFELGSLEQKASALTIRPRSNVYLLCLPVLRLALTCVQILASMNAYLELRAVSFLASGCFAFSGWPPLFAASSKVSVSQLYLDNPLLAFLACLEFYFNPSVLNIVTAFYLNHRSQEDSLDKAHLIRLKRLVQASWNLLWDRAMSMIGHSRVWRSPHQEGLLTVKAKIATK